MLGASFRAACHCTTDSCCIHESFGRAVDSPLRTMCTLGFDNFSATDTDVLRFRTFYYGYVAALYFTLVPLSKASGDESPSEVGWRRRFGHREPNLLGHTLCYRSY